MPFAGYLVSFGRFDLVEVATAGPLRGKLAVRAEPGEGFDA
jgi:hypothetical protein